MMRLVRQHCVRVLQRNKDDWRQSYVVMRQQLLVHLQLKMIRLVFIKGLTVVLIDITSYGALGLPPGAWTCTPIWQFLFAYISNG